MTVFCNFFTEFVPGMSSSCLASDLVLCTISYSSNQSFHFCVPKSLYPYIESFSTFFLNIYLLYFVFGNPACMILLIMLPLLFIMQRILCSINKLQVSKSRWSQRII
jgi:hypothetical protein